MTSYMFSEDKLEGEYKDAFRQIELYATMQQIDSNTENEMLMEIIDILLSAQEHKKPVEKIIGNDIEQFCEDFFKEHKWYHRVRDINEKLYTLMWFMFVFEILNLLGTEGTIINNLNTPSDIGYYFLGFAEGVIIFAVLGLILKPLIFKFKWLSMGKVFIIDLVVTLLAVFGILFLIGGADLFVVPAWASILIPFAYIVVYIICRAIKRYRHHGTIFKEKLPGEKGFWGMVKEQAFNDHLAGEYKKRYDKINQKRSKKNKPSMTGEEFTEKIRREHKLSKATGKPVVALLIIMLIVIIVMVMIDDGIANGLFCMVVLAIAELPAMFIFWAGFAGDKEREILFQECEKYNLTIPAYAEMLEKENEAKVASTEDDLDINE